MSEPGQPLGQFGGTGPGHRQVRAALPAQDDAVAIEVGVDELLAPLLVELWRRGVQTTGSGQNAALIADDWDGEESGEAHIRFGSVEWAEMFATFVGDEAIVHRDFEGVDPLERVGPGAIKAVERLPADLRPDWPTRSLCVAFPAEMIDDLERDLREQRERESRPKIDSQFDSHDNPKRPHLT